MSDRVSRRDWIKATSWAGLATLVPLERVAAALRSPWLAVTDPRIRRVSSTSDVFIPPRANAWMKFSFDFPEPAFQFRGYRFSFLLFTSENTYALDPDTMRVEGSGDHPALKCEGLTWAGGQERADGSVTVEFSFDAGVISWRVFAKMDRPIKSITSVIRDVPLGPISLGGGPLIDPKGDDAVGGYPFCAGDLHGDEVPTSMSTPVAVVQAGERDFWWISMVDPVVRPKRFYFQTGPSAYRVEAVYEHHAWHDDTEILTDAWRIGRAQSFEAAMASHMEVIEFTHHLAPWETRTDVLPWMRDIALVVTLHGMHYTGFIFNDYAKQFEILTWIGKRFDARRALVFLPAWDGRYYWDYPNYAPHKRMGGEAGFKALVAGAQSLGFKIMPMFGANAANRNAPSWRSLAPAQTIKLDGNAYNIDWVDWNNDRHQDGWLAYMNLGAEAWRRHLEMRIGDCIETYGVDAYFLDIVGGHVNSTTGDMHEGTRALVRNLRETYPKVAVVGEMPYDALHGFIPMYQAGYAPRWEKYSRYYSHLSAPAPGRGSSGVHESGFSKFDESTLGLSPHRIPTLQVVDDTFTAHQREMEAILQLATQRAAAR